MKRSSRAQLAVFGVLILLCVVARLLPAPPNFAPVAGAALFAGVFFQRRLVALLVPLVALLVSDLFVGFYDLRLMAGVYLAMLVPVGLSYVLRQRLSVVRLAGCALASSVLFFLLSNFAVWLLGPYGYSFSGFLLCYTQAIPFFQYTLAGDLLWSGVLFGSYALATGQIDWGLDELFPPRGRLQPVPVPKNRG